MSQGTDDKNDVEITLDNERKESEARAILTDLERLITTPQQRKRRWIWELLQNAKDCGVKDGTPKQKQVTVSIVLEKDKLIFSHDGIPFTLKNILALVRRTSTKSFDTSDGNTGKFGTGFVTTHALNRKVKVSGLLYNKQGGLNNFEIIIDRSSTELKRLQEELKKVFMVINHFYISTSQTITSAPLTQYEYELTEESYELAQQSVGDFIKNLPFTLLINAPGDKTGIHAVNVTVDGKTKKYALIQPKDVHNKVKFSELVGNETEELDRQGLLHYSEDNILLAIPAVKIGEVYKILKIGTSSRLFKEFPLVGTEEWHVPYLIQSEDFSPSEPRDGIRTIKDNENKIDQTADVNREALIKYRNAAQMFFTELNSLKVDDLFRLTESGLPDEKTEYTAKDWYRSTIQIPFREFLIKEELLVTANGVSLKIVNAKIPYLFADDLINDQFYKIAVQYYYNEFPEETNFKDWQRIIHQEIEEWGSTIVCTPENLVKDISTQGIDKLHLGQGDTKEQWLNQLIGFLNSISRADLGETYAIYPNQEGKLKKKQELRVDPGLANEIKSIGHRLGLAVYSELLDTAITTHEGMDIFNVKNYLSSINKALGELVPSENKTLEYDAVMDLAAMQIENPSEGRKQLYLHIKQLLPQAVPESYVIEDMDDIHKSISARLAVLKYICWLINKEENFTSFKIKYFEGNDDVSYLWLNTFIEILYRRSEFEDLLRKYAVIPMQDGSFSKLESFIFREDKNEKFDPVLKNLYTNFARKGPVGNILVALPITYHQIPWSTANIISSPVDELFIKPDIEIQVMPDKPLNLLFNELNDWLSSNEEVGFKLFPHFVKARPDLYVKAFGPDIRKLVMKVHKLNKPFEEIEALSNLNVSAAELSILIKASKMAGGTSKLMQAAIEIEAAIADAEWRKKVGDAAEKAFETAMMGCDFQITNPDRGYDFAIHYPEKESYFLEIKSTIESKETIKMSSLQGTTARDNNFRYALCVIIREEIDTIVDAPYFIENAKFILGVGSLIKDKVDGMQNSLHTIGTYNQGEIKTRLDSEGYSVNISRSAWDSFLDFEQFLEHLRIKHFKIFNVVDATLPKTI